ncbi:hypothetical protein SAMN05518849_12340 [Sphingobium sp. AP50]|uniref:hypothetical protein n=1 Tax=Sphingobium sp. AP50 TaxID=1884369 RepID=UPI0008B11840|nr:hypothetical protein [Sphingobium sp. AP50]SEJ98761.1 hypothetical protein SAMN05518849_12340 [Sphingobium sp. AP50]
MLPAEDRHRIAREMARYSGLRPEVIERYGLKVGAEDLANELLRDQGKSISFHNTRIAWPLQTGAYDAALMPQCNAHPGLAERPLLNRTLGMTSSDYYAGPFGGGWPVKTVFRTGCGSNGAWVWNRRPWASGSRSSSRPFT